MTANIEAGWKVAAMIFTFDGARPSVVSWDPEFGGEINYDELENAASLKFLSLALLAFCLAVLRMH